MNKGVIKVSFCNQVPKAMRYVSDAYSPKEPQYKLWTQYNFRQRFYFGCHVNQITIAIRHVADVYSPKEPAYKIWTQYDLRQSSY